MLKSLLQNKLLLDDTFLVGTADLSGLIDRKYGDYKYGISIGKILDDTIIDSIANGPTIEYYNYYQRVNNELAAKAEEIKKELHKINVYSIVLDPTVTTNSSEYKAYLNNLSVDISHKMVATRAGLGWIGKTDLFISTQFGPRLRLVSILINKNPGINSIPIDESRCGKCNVCVEKCPAQAATGELWNINLHRDKFFDAFKCREMCGQLAKQRFNVDIRICGICVSVCPIGKKNKKKSYTKGVL
ncbi:MAG: epoxyqueuosine reductase [Bacteroidales bacterium]|nr:epoxyqueuosine reductase [Bacteroidales bacterium]